MICKYKCTWVDNIQEGFTVDKVYTLDTEKETFLDDNNHNWNTMIRKSNGSYETNPKKWPFSQRTFAIVSDHNEKKITIKCDGNKVIAKMGKQIGEAKCHEDDEFDYYTGARLALDRLFKKDKNEKDKNEKEHEKYLYKLGDKVKIINPGLAYTSYIDFFEKNCKYNLNYQDWVKRYAFGDDLGYHLKAKDSRLYNELYGDRKYTIIFINDGGKCVIENCDTGATYIVDRKGLEKVNS